MGKSAWVRVGAWVATIAMWLAMGAGTAAAQDPVQLYPRMFPAQIAGSQRTEVINFEKDYPGFGYGAKYTRPSWSITTYIYDTRLQTIPEGIGSPAVAGELEKSKGELLGAKKYQSTVHTKDFQVRDDRQQPRLACAMYRATLKEGGENDTYVCLGGWNNKFVKFRVSVVPREVPEGRVRSYIEDWVRQLWP